MPNHLIPHAHLALITKEEARLFQEKIGKHLRDVYWDAMFAVLVFEDSVVYVDPQDETGGSPAHPSEEEIMRISFILGAENDERFRVFTNFEDTRKREINVAVSGIRVLNSLVIFGDPEEIGPTKILGIDVDVGREYDVNTLKPFQTERFNDKVAELATYGLVNQVDVGVVIDLANREHLVMCTDGWSYAVEVHDPEATAHHECLDSAIQVQLEERLTGC